MAGDDVDGLIEKSKAQDESVEDVSDDVPPAFLLGDRKSVTIYSSTVYGGNASPVCQSFPFDELIELSNGNPENDETVLNMKIPRVKQVVEESCLIRPGDDVIAITASSQTWVAIKDFVIVRAQALCPSDSPYSLVGRIGRSLEADPLFYSTDPELKEGENEYVGIAMSPGSIEGARIDIPDVKDYIVTTVQVSGLNVDALFHLKRRSVTPDDDYFPNEMVYWQKGDKLELLTQEAVDSLSGSGHVRVEGIFDYNRDGFLDIWISGDQKTCPYHLLFDGSENGFTPIDLPNKPCSC